MAIKKFDVEDILDAHKIRKTVPRLRVLSIIANNNMAVAGKVLMRKTKDMNRSTRYKALVTLEAKGIIYKIYDLKGTVHYAVRPPDGGITKPAVYAHFNCTRCKKIFPLNDVACHLPPLPEGFIADGFTLGVKGICPSCDKSLLV